MTDFPAKLPLCTIAAGSPPRAKQPTRRYIQRSTSVQPLQPCKTRDGVDRPLLTLCRSKWTPGSRYGGRESPKRMLSVRALESRNDEDCTRLCAGNSNGVNMVKGEHRQPSLQRSGPPKEGGLACATNQRPSSGRGPASLPERPRPQISPVTPNRFCVKFLESHV